MSEPTESGQAPSDPDGTGFSGAYPPADITPAEFEAWVAELVRVIAPGSHITNSRPRDRCRRQLRPRRDGPLRCWRPSVSDDCRGQALQKSNQEAFKLSTQRCNLSVRRRR